jgi:F1F0 ATPase subunit 2
MNIVWSVVLAFLAGLAIGQFYFGGLWLTVRRLPVTRSPALLAFVSFAVRTGISVFIFYLLSLGGHWERLLASVAGFALMRMVLVWRLRPRQSLNQEGVGGSASNT